MNAAKRIHRESGKGRRDVVHKQELRNRISGWRSGVFWISTTRKEDQLKKHERGEKRRSSGRRKGQGGEMNAKRHRKRGRPSPCRGRNCVERFPNVAKRELEP